MSKPIKREFGNRSIPAWATGAGGEKFTDITYQVGEGMAKIAINRPDVRNAFRPQTIIELQEAFSLARDNSEVGVIIFTGTGDEAFCSGGDISVRGDDGYLGEDPLAQKGIGRLNVLDLQIQIRRTPKPVVAMVAGWAIGGGHVLHVVCDLTIAADNAKFGQPEIKLGIIPGAGGTQRLPRAISKAKAMDMCLTSRMMDAVEAERSGLVSRVVPLDKLMEEALAAANTIASMSLPVVMMIKESVNRAYETTLSEGVQYERRLFHSTFATEDQKEGMKAFTEKRAPIFKNQ